MNAGKLKPKKILECPQITSIGLFIICLFLYAEFITLLSVLLRPPNRF